MQILITNDDGFYSPGLAAMARVLRKLGDVCIVAPETEQSGVGMRMTFLQPVNVKGVYRGADFWGYAVAGSPADCIKIGIDQLAPVRPDLVVSGLNNGLNAGANLFYSGTLGGAMEGAFQGITSFAVSMSFQTDPADNTPFEKAAEIAGILIRRILEKNDKNGRLYNINIPNEAIKRETIEKTVVVPVDQKVFWNQYEQGEQSKNRNSFWLAGKPFYEPVPDETDIGKVSNGFITITPLEIDMTKRDLMQKMRSWNLEGEPIPVPENSEIMDFRVIRQYKM